MDMTADDLLNLTDEQRKAIIGTDYDTVLAEALRRKRDAGDRVNAPTPELGHVGNGHRFVDYGGTFDIWNKKREAKNDLKAADKDYKDYLGRQDAGRDTLAKLRAGPQTDPTAGAHTPGEAAYMRQQAESAPPTQAPRAAVAPVAPPAPPVRPQPVVAPRAANPDMMPAMPAQAPAPATGLGGPIADPGQRGPGTRQPSDTYGLINRNPGPGPANVPGAAVGAPGPVPGGMDIQALLELLRNRG